MPTFIKYINPNDNTTVYTNRRYTGTAINILGICFGEENTMEVIEWPKLKWQHGEIPVSKELVLSAVKSCLPVLNEAYGTDYKISKIYFQPSDSPSESSYSLLTSQIIRRFIEGGEFKERQPPKWD